MRMSRCQRPAFGGGEGGQFGAGKKLVIVGGERNTFVSCAGETLHHGFPVQYFGF